MMALRALSSNQENMLNYFARQMNTLGRYVYWLTTASANKILLTGLVWYQYTLSPDHGFFRVFFPNGYCQFYPTCSAYALEAVSRHGVLSGTKLILLRLSRCNPFSRGGIDRVPEIKI